MDNSGIVDLVKKLVKKELHLTDNNDDRVKLKSHLQFSMRLLGSNMTPSIKPDLFSSVEFVKRTLVRQQKTNQAVLFDESIKRLQQIRSVQNLWALLYLLQSLSGTAHPVTTPIAPLETGFYSLGLSNIEQSTAPPPQKSPSSFLPKQPQSAPRSTFSGQISENALLKDIVFTFQGIDGQFVYFDKEKDRVVVDPVAELSPALTHLVLRLCECGWLFKRISAFITHAQKVSETGTVAQAFVAVMQRDLAEYYKLLAVLEGHLNADSSATPSSSGYMTVRRLAVWTAEPLTRLRVMAILTDSVHGLKGGALVSKLCQFQNHGDPFIHDYVSAVLVQVSRPVFEAVEEWVCNGVLNDAWDEFFIRENLEAEDTFYSLWVKRFALRESMLPLFISAETAHHLLLIGKTVRFLCRCGDGSLHTVEKSLLKGWASGEIFNDIESFDRTVRLISTQSSMKFLQIFFSKYKLMEHCNAVKSFLLLEQGDFVQALMDSLAPYLSQAAHSLFKHNLTGILDMAVRSSNAQFYKQEILDRIDVRLMEGSGKDSGWEVFTLDYHIVDAPASVVLSPAVMRTGVKVFAFLWRLKRMDYALTEGWRGTTSCGPEARAIPFIANEWHRMTLVRHQLYHFMHTLSHYMQFEVLQCAWKDLETSFEQATCLDDIIAGYNEYFHSVIVKSILADDAESVEVRTALFAVIELIPRFCHIIDRLCALITAHALRSRQAQLHAEEEGLAGQWGVTADNDVDSAPSELEQEFPHLSAQLSKIQSVCEKHLDTFINLLRVQSSSHEYFRFLLSRLDFSNFYDNV